MLSGLRVVEVGQYVAAPLAATIFADLGASVVKVERPGGDPLRADPARFAAWNRGKESVELDLRSTAGKKSLHDLLDGADLLLENLRPGALERLGLAPATLRADRPRLVTCSITAWGADGPSRDDPGWEPLVHARAGAQQGLFSGDDPLWLPFPVASVSAALVAVLGSRGRADQARLDRLRPTRRDLPPRCALVLERGGDLPSGRAPAPHYAPDQVADPARLRYGRRRRRHGQPQRDGALARALPRPGHGRRRPRLLDTGRAFAGSPTASGTGTCCSA